MVVKSSEFDMRQSIVFYAFVDLSQEPDHVKSVFYKFETFITISSLYFDDYIKRRGLFLISYLA